LGSLVITKQSTASGTFTVTSIQARPAAGGPAISGQGSQVGNTENFSFPGITSGQWNIQIQVTLSDPTASLLWLSIPADFDLWAQPGGIGTQFIASTNNPITVSGSTTLNLSATEG